MATYNAGELLGQPTDGVGGAMRHHSWRIRRDDAGMC